MKTYKIKKYQPFSISTNSKTIKITNMDENPLIREISFQTSPGPSDEGNTYAINVDIDNETQQIRNKFHTISNAAHKTQRMGNEYIINQLNQQDIVRFIDIIQEIDPLPIEVIEEISELGFDVKHLLFKDKVIQLATLERRQDALDLAINACQRGDNDTIIELSNFYQNISDEKHYYEVLKSIPMEHPEYKQTNILLHDYCQSLPLPKNAEEKIDLLQKKFTYAMNGGLSTEASYYFHQLCGNEGLSPIVDICSKDALIKIAANQRRMHAELNQLRAEKNPQGFKFFDNLPHEVQLNIVSKASSQDQSRLAQVSRYCHQLINQHRSIKENNKRL